MVNYFKRQRKVDSFRLTPQGKRYVDSLVNEALERLKPKDIEHLENSSLFDEFM